MKTNPSLLKNYQLTFMIVMTAIVITACSGQPQVSPEYAQLPVGKAFADGKEIFFIHTEASDPEIAEKLTNMMKSPVILVPSLAEIPQESLANVYVFENGISGMGPLGFQSDVFNNPPGNDGYTPLRQIILVKWTDGASARILTSAGEILQSESDGDLTTSRTDVVVNMPFVVWDGGKR